MKPICACALCGRMLVEGDQLGEKKLFDFEGDLKYIELVHLECGRKDNAERGYYHWDISPLVATDVTATRFF